MKKYLVHSSTLVFNGKWNFELIGNKLKISRKGNIITPKAEYNIEIEGIREIAYEARLEFKFLGIAYRLRDTSHIYLVDIDGVIIAGIQVGKFGNNTLQILEVLKEISNNDQSIIIQEPIKSAIATLSYGPLRKEYLKAAWRGLRLPLGICIAIIIGVFYFVLK